MYKEKTVVTEHRSTEYNINVYLLYLAQSKKGIKYHYYYYCYIVVGKLSTIILYVYACITPNKQGYNL